MTVRRLPAKISIRQPVKTRANFLSANPKAGEAFRPAPQISQMMSELLKTLPTREFHEKEIVRSQKIMEAARARKHHMMKKIKTVSEVLSESDAQALHATAGNLTDEKIEAYLFWRRLWAVSRQITDHELVKLQSKVCQMCAYSGSLILYVMFDRPKSFAIRRMN
jgi:hypothetical protein